MASGASQLSLVERSEIHKSCKTLETVVNVLNDYCEAANAIVALQRKLAKALREAASASVKCVAEIPANALNTSATMFETLSEVDVKFVKLADKECDGMSAEVKKWFKKLAKEEKTHDLRIANANAKIQQAGQSYEKKTKKNPQSAADEHTRYMSVLNSIGPDINQAKYNHALFVTQRHNSTLHILAASLARVADAEWLRSCDSVRQFSPTVGQLAEWRAYCEGGWSGPVPKGLPSPDARASQAESSEPGKPDTTQRAVSPHPLEVPRELQARNAESPAPEYSSRHASEQDQEQTAPLRAVTPSGELAPPSYAPITKERPVASHSPEVESKDFPDQKSHSTVSLASLDSFPSPPTHFPLPSVNGNDASGSGQETNGLGKESQSQGKDARRAPPDIPFPRNTESPLPMTASETRHMESQPVSEVGGLQSGVVSSSPVLGGNKPPEDGVQLPSPTENKTDEGSVSPTAGSATARVAESTLAVNSSTTPMPIGLSAADSSDGSELEIRKTVDAVKAENTETRESSAQAVERSDTGRSNGSIVAALRNKYTRPTGPSSPPRKEVPRVPTSVSHLATKYEPVTTPPTSPRLAQTSIMQDPRRLVVDMSRRMSQPPLAEPTYSSASSKKYAATEHSTEVAGDSIAVRRWRVEELEELELREQELELRFKEREIERRAKELEMERARLRDARSPNSGYGSDTSTRYTVGTSRKMLDASSAPMTATRLQHPSHSFSTTNLHPQAAVRPQSGHSSSQPSSPLYQSADHAPYCGCEACSASKYSVRDPSPSARDSRPLQAPITLKPEKPKGWIRRLSMPVMGNAFSLDSKRNLSNAGIASGPGTRSSLALVEEDGLLRRDATGGIRNRSTTNLARR